MAELAESIREQGVLQPLIVRVIAAPQDDSGVPIYEIVAGERRWRAARLAGLETVPVIVSELTDQSALAVALIENLQREDLNPIDQARSMRRLIDEFNLTHDEIAKALGRSRASVTNSLRLLDLADDVKDAMVSGTLDMGHARALLPLDPGRTGGHGAQDRATGVVGAPGREGCADAARVAEGGDAKTVVDLQTRWLQNQLAREIGESISIRPGGKGDYVLKIEFANLSQLDSALQQLHDLISQIRQTAVAESAGRVLMAPNRASFLGAQLSPGLRSRPRAFETSIRRPQVRDAVSPRDLERAEVARRRFR